MNRYNRVETEEPFRVAVLHSSDSDLVILKNDFSLPAGTINQRESFENAAQRIALETFDMEHLSAVARLNPIDGVEGFVLEAAGGKKTDLRRSFAGRAFELDFILKDYEENADKYRKSDIQLLRSYQDRTYRK